MFHNDKLLFPDFETEEHQGKPGQHMLTFEIRVLVFKFNPVQEYFSISLSRPNFFSSSADFFSLFASESLLPINNMHPSVICDRLQ